MIVSTTALVSIKYEICEERLEAFVAHHIEKCFPSFFTYFILMKSCGGGLAMSLQQWLTCGCMYSGLVANTLVGWRTTNGLDCEARGRLTVKM